MTHNPNKTPLSTERPDVAILREKSGSIEIESRLVSFLYELMRDHVPPGVLEEVLRKSTSVRTAYTNGWLAKYAEHVASQLQPPPSATPPPLPKKRDPRSL